MGKKGEGEEVEGEKESREIMSGKDTPVLWRSTNLQQFTCRESDGVGKLVLIFVHKLVHINQPCVHLGREKGEIP